jgi:membrane protein YdbS with pleckstrin-like domain
MNAAGEPRKPLLRLEQITAVVLVLVLAALVWIVAAAAEPGWAEWATTDLQAILVVVLLTAALGLVSALALLHTAESHKSLK